MKQTALIFLLLLITPFSMAPLSAKRWIKRSSSFDFLKPDLEKYVDALPIPPVLRFDGPDAQEITLTINQFQTQLHRDLPVQTVWGYNGSSPGPTIEVQKGQRLRVHWRSELPASHVFPTPKGAETGMPGMSMPDVRSVTHLHGAVVSQPSILPASNTSCLSNNAQTNSDGWPDAWITSGQEQLADYPNDQPAMALWYHDHAMGETGRNVAAGLAGLYLIRDQYEQSLNLPSGKFEIPLLLESKGLNPDGTLFYSDDIGTEYYGNAMTVNGKLWPYLNVEPRKYRFRIVNASNARSYAMKLMGVSAADSAVGPAFMQIGSDGGFLENTVMLNDPSSTLSPRLFLAPAERADVIIDFSNYPGQNFLLQNNARDPDESGLPEIMQIRVGTQLSEVDTSSLPVQMKPIPRIPLSDVSTTRQIVFNSTTLADGTQMLNLNGKSWTDPIEEKPILGSTEIWELTNTLIDTHPFHIHQMQFQVLDRRLFDVADYLKTGKITYTGDAVPPLPNEMGWKDTIKVLPQMVTRIILRFGPYPGYYVYHCHILEHEDMDMMRPFQIVDPAREH